MAASNNTPAFDQSVACAQSGAACSQCSCAKSGTKCAQCSCTSSATNAGSDDKCTTCGDQLKSGQKYQNICTTCQPNFNNWCSGCQRKLWDCMCIRPHTWE